jgi:hypothetical protein
VRTAVRLLAEALRARVRISLAMFGIAVLAAVTAATGPLWTRAAEESLVRDALLVADPADTQFVAVGGIQPTIGADDVLEGVRKAAADRSLDRWFGPPTAAAWLPVTTLRHGGRDLALARVGWFSAACTTVTVVRGTCPDGPGEVLLGEDAQGLGLRLGDTLDILQFDFAPGATPHVVGFYRPANADSPVWGGQNVFDGAPARAGVLDQLDTAFVDRATALATQSIEFRASAARPLVVERLRLADLPVVTAAVRALTDPSRPTLAQVSSGLPAELRSLGTERETVRVTAAAVVLQLTLLAMFVLYLVCVAGAEAREPELAVAKLRGVRPGRALLLVLAEPAAILLAAAAAGLAAAWPLTWVLVRLTLRPGTPVELTAGAVAAVAAVVVAGLGVAALSSQRAVLAPVAALLRRATGHRTSRRRATAVDVAVGVAAAAAVYELAQGRTDLLTLVGPGVLAFTAGFLLSRLLRPAAGVVQRATRWTSRTTLFLAARQVGRRPATHRLVVLAAAAVALATFAINCSLVAERNRVEQAALEVGAHRVLHVARTDPGELLAAVRRADPSGTAAMAVLESTESSPTGPMLAVDTERLAAVSPATLRHVNLAAADVTGRLRPPQRAPYVVRDGMTADVTSRNITLPLHLVALVELPTGAEQVLVLGELRQGRHTYTARAPGCAAGCRVARLMVEYGDAGETSVAGLVVHRLADLRGAELPAADLARWRGVPADPSVFDSLPVMSTAPAPDGVAIAVSGQVPNLAALEPDDHPQYLQGVTGAGVRGTNAVPGKGLPAAGLDGTLTLVRPVGRADVVPRLGDGAVLVDLEYADRASAGPPTGAVESQVWLSPSAGPGVEAALVAAGLRVESSETAAGRRDELDRTGVATGLRLYLVVSLASLALVLAALVATLLAGAARRGWEVSVLRVIGTRARTVTGAAALEHVVLLLVGAGAGFAAGLVAAWLSLPALLASTSVPTDVPATTAPAWAAMGAFAAGIVVVTVLVSLAAARASTAAARPSRLREAQP